ncbi:MAG TPA: hypothetical protein DHU72_02990 [Rikenellaceae bacterium]|nr:hypothetical protein [Rikenellaceae bacterium]
MKNFFSIFFATLILGACEGFNPITDGEIVDIIGSEEPDMLVLGSKLDNPYSVANIKAAFKSIYPDADSDEYVKPTDMYVRFLPESDAQMKILSDLGVELVDHPVDYEIVKEGNYYHDPSVPDDQITWQYATVPIDFLFPDGIRAERLDLCVLQLESATKSGMTPDWEAVERESYRMTGNEYYLLSDTKASDKDVAPEGRITIEDPKFSGEPIGVKGVKVSCNSFVRFSSCFTDEDGYYKMDKTFSGKVRYRIVYKNKYGFAQGFNLILSPASYTSLGSHPASGVSLAVTSSSDRKLFTRCAVNNAAYDYYKQCRSADSAMQIPPSNLRIWQFQKLRKSCAVMLQQGAVVNSSKLADYLGSYMFILKLFLPDITLGLAECRTYSEIYALTVHELSHASHYMVVGNEYWDKYVDYIITSFISSGMVTYGTGSEENHGYCEVGEMWAYYMQSTLYNERYPSEKLYFGQNYWFHPQIFTILDEKCLDKYRIFGALDTDVIDRKVLKKRMLSMYPQYKTAINQAFSKYN